METLLHREGFSFVWWTMPVSGVLIFFTLILITAPYGKIHSLWVKIRNDICLANPRDTKSLCFLYFYTYT